MHICKLYSIQLALRQVSKKHPDIQPRVITFLIHFGQWPIAQGAGAGAHLNPPDGFPGNGGRWVSFQLKPEEIQKKREAILQYRTQMLVMGRLLLSFARSNELYLLEE